MTTGGTVTVNTGDPKVDAAIDDLAMFQTAMFGTLIQVLHRQDLARFDDLPAGLRSIAQHLRERKQPDHPLGEQRLDVQLFLAMAGTVERMTAAPTKPAGPNLRVVD